MTNRTSGKIHSIAKTNMVPQPNVPAPITSSNIRPAPLSALYPINIPPQQNPITSHIPASYSIPQQGVPVATSSIQQQPPQPQPAQSISSSSLHAQQQQVEVAPIAQIAVAAPPEQVLPSVQNQENQNVSRIGNNVEIVAAAAAAAAVIPFQINELGSSQISSQVQVSQIQAPAGLVNCTRKPLVQILSMKNHTLLLLVTETSVHLQPVSSLHKSNTAIHIYTLPDNWKFTNAFPASNLILLSACTEEDSFGILSINLDVNSVVPERRGDDMEEMEEIKKVLKKIFLPNIETSPITSILWEEDLGILMFSTESGNIHGFSSNLDRIFFFEEPNGNQITNILYDSCEEVIIYTTSAGLVAKYNMNTEQSEEIFKGNGYIIKASFVSGCKGILLIFEKGIQSSAVYVSYPKMRQKFEIGIDSPNYACVLEDPISNNSENSLSSSILSSNSSIIKSSTSSLKSSLAGSRLEEKVRYRMSFGILSKSKLSIFSFNRKNAVKIYSKTLYSEPSCFTFKTDLSHMELIEAYYSNPIQVRDDIYAKDRCRYLIDKITAKFL